MGILLRTVRFLNYGISVMNPGIRDVFSNDTTITSGLETSYSHEKNTHTHQNLEQVSSQIKKFFVMKWAKNQMVYSWNRVVYKIKKLANNPNDRPIIKWKRLPLPTKISGGPQKNPFNGKKRKCAWKWQNSINLFFIWPPFVFFYE